ncbi:hypothetical protein EMIT0P228_80219 [Pseudomonas brassicacearum]
MRKIPEMEHDDEDGCLLTHNLWERAFVGAELARDGDDTV